MTDVVIIGGGIIGLLTAREFSRNGASVRMLERKRIGHEASWAGGGILSPLYPWRQSEAISALCSWSQARYSDLANSLTEATGIDPEWTQTGILIADNPYFSDAENWCRAHSTEFRRVSSEDIKKFGSSLQCQGENPIYLPHMAQIRNPRFLKALSLDLQQSGVNLLEGCQVADFVVEKQHIRHLKTTCGKVFGDHFVLTAGAWTRGICEQLLVDLKIEPVKGQMILFNALPGFLSTIVVDHGHYFVPRKDGRILVGSTLEKSGFDPSTTDAGRDELESFAYSRMPDLKKFPLEKHWAGLRPGTPSGIPYIYKHLLIDNLSVNCGHFRNGFAMGPASARLLLDLVLGRNPIVAPEPYSGHPEEPSDSNQSP